MFQQHPENLFVGSDVVLSFKLAALSAAATKRKLINCLVIDVNAASTFSAVRAEDSKKFIPKFCANACSKGNSYYFKRTKCNFLYYPASFSWNQFAGLVALISN